MSRNEISRSCHEGIPIG